MRLICPQCKYPMETSYLTMLMQCVESIWGSEIIKKYNLTDELRKDLAISLFIAIGKDLTTKQIQQFKQENIRKIKR